jgi:hypothetical protein
MTSKRSRRKKRKAVQRSTPSSKGFTYTPLILIALLISIALTIYIAYRASLSDSKLFSFSLIALFLGLLYESYRITKNWKSVLQNFIIAYLFSFVIFLPGKHEQNYVFEEHIEMWPNIIIIVFALFFVISHKEKVTAKLNEGIALLLSISFIYWSIDYSLLNYHNWFSLVLLIIGTLFSILTLFNGLTYLNLTKTNRFFLSLWSTIIMFAFAMDNITSVTKTPDIESSIYLSDSIFRGLQYFLLGTSAVYIIQNALMLLEFKENFKENIKDHINRFSDEQIPISASLLCIAFSGTVYWLNYKYQLLPRYTMIWFVIMIFPLVSQFIHFKRLTNPPTQKRPLFKTAPNPFKGIIKSKKARRN